MTIVPRQVHYPYTEYVRLEEFSGVRHEYVDGEIYAMAGGTPDHAALAAVVITVITQHLPRGCRAFSSDLRVRIPLKKMATYPDATVVCGALDRAADDKIAITNPLLLVEVTSNSTETYDRNAKLDSYRTIASLEEVLIVSHREPRLTIHRRGASQWTMEEARAGGSVRLESIDVTLNVDDIYRDPLEDIR